MDRLLQQTSFKIATSRRLLLLLLCAAGLSLGDVNAYPTPKKMPEGWDAKITFGAQATAGATRSESLHASADASYRNARWENRIKARLHRSNVSVSSTRVDDNGDEELDAAGEPLLFLERKRTNNRRMLGLEPRFFIKERVYLFALLDLEENKPANISLSSRQVGGFGYRWWKNKRNFLSMGFGVGHKQLKQVNEARERDGIGYVGLRLVRQLNEQTSVDFSIDTDFGSDNRQTEVSLGLSWKINDPFSLKFGIESRMNSDINSSAGPFDESVDAEFTASLVYRLF